VLLPRQQAMLARGAKDKEHAMSQTPNTAITVIGIDIGKNSFHVDANSGKSTCNARLMLTREVGDALNNGHRQPSLSGPKSARLGPPRFN
jgi:hypothetical protein